MSELKTRETRASVRTFLDAIPNEERRKDCHTIARLMSKVTGAPPKMWGPGIVGFGSYRYRYPGGREADWMMTGFSPRKQHLALYIMTGFTPHVSELERLGKYTTSKSCLYIKRLADVDLETLERILRDSVAQISDAGADKASDTAASKVR
jgi:hypothetical protein